MRTATKYGFSLKWGHRVSVIRRSLQSCSHLVNVGIALNNLRLLSKLMQYKQRSLDSLMRRRLRGVGEDLKRPPKAEPAIKE
jgi:hypothetical protein